MGRKLSFNECNLKTFLFLHLKSNNFSAFAYLTLHISTIFFTFFYFLFFNCTILYWFCHISKWIHHRYIYVPHPEPSSLLPPHTIPLGRRSAPAPSIQYCASKQLRRFLAFSTFIILQRQWSELSLETGVSKEVTANK